MSILIELFQSTGDPEVQELITNANLKSSGLQSSLSEYFLYPIKRPDSDLLEYSFTNKIFAKVSGTYTKIERPRWKIQIPDLIAKKAKFFHALRSNYSAPSDLLDGTLTFANNKTMYVFPSTNLIGPGSVANYSYDWTTNQTFFTNYLATQLFVEQSLETDIGNIEPIKITFEFDLYE